MGRVRGRRTGLGVHHIQVDQEHLDPDHAEQRPEGREGVDDQRAVRFGQRRCALALLDGAFVPRVQEPAARDVLGARLRSIWVRVKGT